MKKFSLLVILSIIRVVGFGQHDMNTMTSNIGPEKRSEQRGLKRIGPVVEYHLYIKDTTVNFTGRKRKALAINGQIPAPTLRFTEGDSAVIYVHNMLKEEASIHWHGVLLPNEEDGVPILNTQPIRANTYFQVSNYTTWHLVVSLPFCFSGARGLIWAFGILPGK